MRHFRTLLLQLVPLALAAAATVSPSAVSAQAPEATQSPATQSLVPAAPGQTRRLTLTDGSQLVGRIIAVDSTSVRFESAFGTMTIPIASIVDVRDMSMAGAAGTGGAAGAAGPAPEGRFEFPNPNKTRLIFAPTGRMLRKDEGYFSDFWIFFPGVARGITDRFTVGGGMSVLPILALEQIVFLTPKVGLVQRKRFNAAAGVLAISYPDFVNSARRRSVGVAYGVATVGGPDASLTGGIGYGYVETRVSQSPTVMVGGEVRLTSLLSLVSENYVFPGGSGLVSGALRFMRADRSADIGIARRVASAPGTDDGFPVLNFLWKW